MKRRGMYKPLPDAPAQTIAGEGGSSSLSSARTESFSTSPEHLPSPVKNSSSLIALLVRWITSAIHRTSGAGDRIAAWCKGWSDDVVLATQEVCRECERPCVLVNPDVPTAEPCRGRVQIGDCTVCVRTVELTIHNGCPDSAKHLVTNKRDKPYLSLVTNGEP